MQESFWPQPKEPDPFPAFRSRADGHTFLSGLYQGWGGCWSAQ